MTVERRGGSQAGARGRAGSLPSRGGARPWIARLAGPARRHPGRAAAVVAALAAAGTFGWNLLAGQPNRHPAPLLAGADAKVLPPPPLPVPRPEIAAVGSIGGGGVATADKPAAVDPIGGLIRATQADTRTGEATAPRVAAAQRALLKLGYGPLKPDGVLGTGTRQAVERFERASNLPVTGALTGRTVKRLAQAAGVPIE